MTPIHLRFQNSLLTHLVRIRERHERFQRLLRDPPTGITIACRTKSPHADLRRAYVRRIFESAFLSLCAILGLFVLYPDFDPDETERPKPELPIIHIQEIPETVQRARPPPPTRPAVPIPVDNDAGPPEDATIEETDLEFDRVLVHIPPLPTGGRPLPPPEDEAVHELWKVEEQPQVVKRVYPHYPELARVAGLEGTVIVELLIGKDGRVEKAKAVKGPEIFHEAAVEAILLYIFKPARQNDRNVRVLGTLPVEFRLRDD